MACVKNFKSEPCEIVALASNAKQAPKAYGARVRYCNLSPPPQESVNTHRASDAFPRHYESL